MATKLDAGPLKKKILIGQALILPPPLSYWPGHLKNNFFAASPSRLTSLFWIKSSFLEVKYLWFECVDVPDTRGRKDRIAAEAENPQF